jgi:hypothetical protein
MTFTALRILAIGLLLSAAALAQRGPGRDSALPISNDWPNPSAEVNIAGAAAFGPDATGVVVSGDHADAWRGRSSFQLRFTPGPARTAALVFGVANGPAVRVVPGQMCYFRVAGRLVSGSPETELELRARWLDQSGRLIAETPALCHAPSAHRTWTVLDGWDTAPQGATQTALALYATGTVAATVVRADGVQITTDPMRVPPYVAGDEPGSSWTGTAHASASRGPAGVVNLVPNPSFEHGTEMWRSTRIAGASIRSFRRSQSWAASGRFSMRLVGTGSISVASQPIPIVGGQEYTLRATVNSGSIPSGGRVALMLEWLDSAGTHLARQSSADEAFTAAPGIRELEITKPAPRNAVAARISVGTIGAGLGNYDISADAFSLVADSGANPSRPFWVGFNDQLLNRGPLTLDQDLMYDKRLGVNAVRLPINLSLNDLYKQVWPSPEAPINLDPVAPAIDAFFNAGVRVLLLSPVTPWMIKERAFDPAHYADIGRLSAAFVKRWPNIVAVEAHNEPNARNFWHPQADPALFVRFLEQVYRAVKAVNPSMPILAPSCNAPLTANGNMSIPDYMKGFYEAGGGRWCDALSIHPYNHGASSGSGADRTRPFWAGSDECMRQLRAVRDAFHDSAKPIWITELGSATRPPAYPELLKTITEDQQARNTALLYDWARRQPDVQAIIYHTNASHLNPREGDFGLVTADGRLKPAFLTLQSELHRTPPDYFDGDTPGCRWIGHPGASASIKTVTNGSSLSVSR